MSVQQLILLKGGALILFAGSIQTAAADVLGPFRAPNLSPPSAIIGLPLWAEVPETTSFGFTTEIANHYRLKRRSGDQVILDGETVRVRGYLERPFGERWSFGIDLPYVYQSGGVLDDLVDAWHSAFSLPDGARNQRPEGVLQYDLANADGSFFHLSESGGGLGDLQLSVARRLGSGHGWNLRGTVKLPTGNERLLAGSGSTDWMLTALRVVRGDFKTRAASYFFGLGVLAIEQPTQVLFPVEDAALLGTIGGALSIGERFGVKAQIDANSALYDSQLEELGQTAVQANLGGWMRFAGSGAVEFAISEDLHVSTAPDVVFYLNLHWRLP